MLRADLQVRLIIPYLQAATAVRDCPVGTVYQMLNLLTLYSTATTAGGVFAVRPLYATFEAPLICD